MGGQYVPLGYRVAEKKENYDIFITIKILHFHEKYSVQPHIILKNTYLHNRRYYMRCFKDVQQQQAARTEDFFTATSN